MKRLQIMLVLTLTTFVMFAQVMTTEVESFSKISIHPNIEVELRQGDVERVEVVSSEVDPEWINIKVKGKTLQLFLDDAKVVFGKLFRTEDFDQYHGDVVQVVVTYRTLKKITVYGEEELVADNLSNSKMRLKIYGEVDAELAGIEADRLKMSLFGDNRVKIQGGSVGRHVYSSFGDNQVVAGNLKGIELKFTNFGEGRLYVGKQEWMKVTAFGSAYVSYRGNPEMANKIAIGETTFVSR